MHYKELVRGGSLIKAGVALETWQNQRILYICWITVLMTGFSHNVLLWCIMGVLEQRLLVLKLRARQLLSLSSVTSHFGGIECTIEG
nr:hypothetical protein Iba_chr12bCG21210 [Ipomoea batatas]